MIAMGTFTARGTVTVNQWEPLSCMLTVDVGRIDTSVMRDVMGWDPRWIHVDRNGHFHGYTKDGKTPSLEVRATVDPDNGPADSEDFDWFRALTCRICGVEVKPGMRVVQRGGERSFAEGRRVSTIRVPHVPKGHGLHERVMRDPYRPVSGSPRDMLSVYVDLGKVVSTGGGERVVAYFGHAAYGSLEMDAIGLHDVDLSCAWLEEVSYA